MSEDLLCVYHGGQRWKEPPRVMPSRANSYECGPGIYATVNAQTAAKYAKGPGVITEIGLSPDIRWLETARIKFDDVLSFLDSLKKVPSRAEILRWLHKNQERDRHQDGFIDANILLNLMVNGSALGGKNGVHLAQWYTDQGIDASLHDANGLKGREDWVIIFNPAIIKKHQVLKRSDIDWSQPKKPNIAQQLKQIVLQKKALDPGVLDEPVSPRLRPKM